MLIDELELVTDMHVLSIRGSDWGLVMLAGLGWFTLVWCAFTPLS